MTVLDLIQGAVSLAIIATVFYGVFATTSYWWLFPDWWLSRRVIAGRDEHGLLRRIVFGPAKAAGPSPEVAYPVRRVARAVLFWLGVWAFLVYASVASAAVPAGQYQECIALKADVKRAGLVTVTWAVAVCDVENPEPGQVVLCQHLRDGARALAFIHETVLECTEGATDHD